jgi:hypothetical protein
MYHGPAAEPQNSTSWAKEVRRWAPELTIHTYHGPGRRLPTTK